MGLVDLHRLSSLYLKSVELALSNARSKSIHPAKLTLAVSWSERIFLIDFARG